MPGQSTLNAYTVAPGGQGCEPHWVPVFCFPRVKVPSGRCAYPVTAKVIAASSASSRSVTPRLVNLYIFWSTKFVIVSKPGRIHMIHVLGVFPSPGDSFPCEPHARKKDCQAVSYIKPRPRRPSVSEAASPVNTKIMAIGRREELTRRATMLQRRIFEWL